jgi:hypothetical protein
VKRDTRPPWYVWGMRLSDIPKDIAVSVSFVAVFLLAFVPALFAFTPEVYWVAVKVARAARKCNRTPTLSAAD